MENDERNSEDLGFRNPKEEHENTNVWSRVDEEFKIPSEEHIRIEETKKENILASEINNFILNPRNNVKSKKGFEIIAEHMVEKITDIFGKNSLLSMLYQVGLSTGLSIANRLKEKYHKVEFDIIEAVKLLFNETKDFYSIDVKDVEKTDEYIKFIFENYCFLRKIIKRRDSLDFGRSFCRVNKGYFETAFKNLVGNQVKKVEMRFIENNQEKDVCIEEIKFYI